MLTDRPSTETIEAWISGTLPVDVAEMVEDYFTRHPDDLPGEDEPLDHLSQVAESSPVDPELQELMAQLQERQRLPEMLADPVLDLLTPTDQPGCLGTLAHYRILEIIATTGMGMVWKAHDPKLNRQVAIKVLAPTLAYNKIARRRFEQEARAMAALENEHILPIYEVQNDSPPWFVMRLANGGSLQEVIDQQANILTKPEYLELLMRQMASALACAHEAGIIHRDLKPANILLSKNGDRFWLTDFGIARVTENPELTYRDTVVGTPRYMSPEQARGDAIDARSDLFSLGSVLYHLASGHPLFAGETSTAILHQLDAAPVPRLQKVNPHLPRWLSHTIDRLLEKDPAKRFQSASELLHALGQKKAPAAQGIWKPSLVAVACIVIGALLFGIWPRTQSQQSDSSFSRQAVPQVESSSSTMVTVVETGKQYQDLAEAVSQSPDQATLLLRGEFVLSDSIVTRQGRDLHLKAEKGTTPQIIFRHSGKYGFLIHGSGKATGINFICEHDQEQFKPFMTIGGELCSVRHCQFLSRNPDKLVWAVTAKATKRIEAYSCVFRGEKLYATLLYDTHPGEVSQNGELFMSDCALSCRGGIFCRSRDENTTYHLRVENTRFQGQVFIETSRYNALRSTELYLQNNHLDFKGCLFQVAKGDQDWVRDQLSWTGVGNHYQNTRPYLFVKRPEHLSFRGIDEMKAYLRTFSEHALKETGDKNSSEGAFEQFLRRVREGVENTWEKSEK